jgi:hypothetical protein
MRMQMVFTSILVHGVTVPMSKAMMHGVTLTKTLTQTGEPAKSKPQNPVSVSDIQRIGIPVPLPTYNSATGKRVAHSSTQISTRSRASSVHGAVGSQDPMMRERDVGLAPEPVSRALTPAPEGRTVA